MPRLTSPMPKGIHMDVNVSGLQLFIFLVFWITKWSLCFWGVPATNADCNQIWFAVIKKKSLCHVLCEKPFAWKSMFFHMNLLKKTISDIGSQVGNRFTTISLYSDYIVSTQCLYFFPTMSTQCYHLSTQCFHIPNINRLLTHYILYKPSRAQGKPADIRPKPILWAMPKPATNAMKTMKHATGAATKPVKTKPMKGHTTMKTMPMKTMPMKGQKTMKTMKTMPMKGPKKTMKSPKAKDVQPMNIPWNGKIFCSSSHCGSWIYVRKSQWYAKCTMCGRPWLTSFQTNGISLPETQVSLDKFLQTRSLLMSVLQKNQTNVLQLDVFFYFFHCSKAMKATKLNAMWPTEPWGTKWLPRPWDASKDGVWKKKLACLLSSMLTRLVCCNICFFSMHEHPVLFVSLSTQCFFFHRAHSALALPTQTKGSAIKISCHLSIPCFIGSVQNILTLSFSFEHSVWLPWAHSACLVRKENG